MQILIDVYDVPEVGGYKTGNNPWSNGVVERHTATLTETSNKTKEP